MKKPFLPLVLFLVFLLFTLSACATPASLQQNTPTPVPTQTAEETATLPTGTLAATATPANTAVQTPFITATDSQTPIPTPVVTNPTNKPTSKPTAKPTAKSTAKPTAQPTAKPTSSPLPTPAPVPTPGLPTPRPTPSGKHNYMHAGESYYIYRWDFTSPTSYLEQDGTTGDYIRQMHAYLESTYGIDIQYVVWKSSNWLNNMLEAAYSGTPAADIFHIGGPYTKQTCYAYNGIPESAIQSLSALSKAATFSDPEYWDQYQQSTFGTINGQLYFANPAPVGFAQVATNQMLFFNKRLVELGGYTPAQLYAWCKNGTWTWERYRQLLVDTTRPDLGTYGAMLGQSGGFLYGLMASNNAAFVKTSVVAGKERDIFAATDSAGVAVYEFYADIVQNRYINVRSNTNDEPASFSEGKYATMLTYLARAADLHNMQDDYGIVLPPKGPNAQTYYSDNNWNNGICLLQNIDNPLGAAQLLEEYFAPAFKKSSDQAKAMMSAELVAHMRDQQSFDICKSVVNYNKPSRFMIYMLELGNPLFYDATTVFYNCTASARAYLRSIATQVNDSLNSIQDMMPRE